MDANMADDSNEDSVDADFEKKIEAISAMFPAIKKHIITYKLVENSENIEKTIDNILIHQEELEKKSKVSFFLFSYSRKVILLQ